MFDELGKRMKEYESVSKHFLMRRLPVIIRVDGKAFHSLTRSLERPWDARFSKIMWETAVYMCQEIQGAQLAYVQSDEISILLKDWQELETQAWFDYNVQKIVSVSASLATAGSQLSLGALTGKVPLFDSRAFNLSKEEVCNYFIWRQNDAVRNSVQSLAQSLYSSKELLNKNNTQLQEMCFQKGHNWGNCKIWQKRGVCIIKKPEEYIKIETNNLNTNTKSYTVPSMKNTWQVDEEIPVFTQNRKYIEQYL